MLDASRHPAVCISPAFQAGAAAYTSKHPRMRRRHLFVLRIEAASIPGFRPLLVERSRRLESLDDADRSR